MSIIIEDLIILGLACPEQIKDGRKTVCVAAYHPDFKPRGLIRIYPARPDMYLSRWDRITARVERNKQDARFESWKFVGSHDHWDSIEISKNGKLKDKSEKITILESARVDCIKQLNSERSSLGVIKPDQILAARMVCNGQFEKPQQKPLMDMHEWVQTKSDYEMQPKIRFRCGEGCQVQSSHDQTVLEWGAYEWTRKNPGNEIQYWENLHLLDVDYDAFLLVGNQCHQLTSFLIINVICFKRAIGKTDRSFQQQLSF